MSLNSRDAHRIDATCILSTTKLHSISIQTAFGIVMFVVLDESKWGVRGQDTAFSIAT
jgi:hypothetical protein